MSSRSNKNMLPHKMGSGSRRDLGYSLKLTSYNDSLSKGGGDGGSMEIFCNTQICINDGVL